MFYPIDVAGSKITLENEEIERLTFKELGLKEVDIENFLIDNLDLLFEGEENLLVVGQQVRNLQNGRNDLVAVDKMGNLVLIEIKRDLDDLKNRREPMEFQAIRYAANLALIEQLDTLVEKIYAPYLERRGETAEQELTASEIAKRKLKAFLESNDSERTFNKKQRIILVAAEYDEQTLSACAWLSDNHVDISCFTIEPRRFKGQLFIDITQVLPVAQTKDFYVDVAISPNSQPGKTGSAATTKRNHLPRMNQLFQWGIIAPNQNVHIKGAENSKAIVKDENTVIYEGEEMTYNQWGKKVTGWSAMSVYEWIVVEGQTETLHQLRLEKMKQEDKQ